MSVVLAGSTGQLLYLDLSVGYIKLWWNEKHKHASIEHLKVTRSLEPWHDQPELLHCWRGRQVTERAWADSGNADRFCELVVFISLTLPLHRAWKKKTDFTINLDVYDQSEPATTAYHDCLGHWMYAGSALQQTPLQPCGQPTLWGLGSRDETGVSVNRGNTVLVPSFASHIITKNSQSQLQSLG